VRSGAATINIKHQEISPPIITGGSIGLIKKTLFHFIKKLLSLADHLSGSGQDIGCDLFHCLPGFARAVLQHLGDGVDPFPDGSGPVVKLGINEYPLLLNLFDCAGDHPGNNQRDLRVVAVRCEDP
jgi:hypothetical protein